MTATFFPTLAVACRAIFRIDGASADSASDQNDPAYHGDRMGTRCQIHDTPRFLDEAPLVPFAEHTMSFHAVKGRTFPNSWTAIASYAATTEGRGVLGRLRRPKVVVVRYCEECRKSAAKWEADQAANGEQ